MSKFDTNGGYFAPKDYLRVNEGGSHEENPNGGVQIGMDPEGAPNLLEEDESVYKDYVYSDNIVAEREFLEQNHLPTKYEGKLYSKIADDILVEAEERPLDPISRSSLEVLLGRLAEAQEAQKQRDQREEVENELAKLSPEELDQLEAMLSEGAQGPSEYPGDAGVQDIPEEQMVGPAEPMPAEEMPMMACGGKLRKFDMGGPKKSMADQVAADILARARAEGRASGMGNTDLPLVSEHPDLDVALAIAQPGSILAKAMAPSVYKGMVNGLANGEPAYAAFAPMAKLKGAKSALTAADVANMTGQIADYSKEIALAQKELAALKKELEAVKKGGPGSKDVIKSNIEKANERIRFAKREQGRLRSKLPKETPELKVTETETEKAAKESVKSDDRTLMGHAVRTAFNPFYAGKQIWDKTKGSAWRWPATAVGGAIGAVPATGVYTGLGKGVETLIDAYSAPVGVDSGMLTPYTGYYSNDGLDEYNFDSEPQNYAKAYGGRINRYPTGGWLDFMNALGNYTYSRNPGGISGTYAIDRSFPLAQYETIQELENSDPYRGFTDYVLANGNNSDVMNYLRALDAGTAKGVTKLFDGDTLRNNWQDIYRSRRYDQKGGIYHLNPADIGFLSASPAVQEPQSPDIQYELFPGQLAAMQYGMQMDDLSPRMRYAMTYNGTAPKEPDAVVSTDEPEVSGKNTGVTGRPATLPTWPRYAGAFGSAMLGLYDIFQSPDRYTAERIHAYTPEGRINLQNQVYNPIDQNMIANSMTAHGNATRRALGNAGLGPSTGAAILAADNNLSGNLGTGFIQAWDANNQRRNAVLAANNQAEAQRASFDFGVDQQRKAALREAAVRNAQNNLLTQRLNYAAEGDKYAAIGNQFDQVLEAISASGRENMAFNQINHNPANNGYMIDSQGRTIYFPSYIRDAAMGGFLKKLKK